jgi:undecaprenyl phosphate-alpha-L-ara4FN deformylase
MGMAVNGIVSVKKLVLKVDVDTYLGTVQGVPALLDLYKKYDVRATFLFSLGPDHTGRAIRRVFRKGFLSKVSRTSVVSNYGYKTLMYGVLLPGPHIGKKCAHIMRRVMEEGHEVGIHCYDHVLWQDFVARKNYDWTRTQMDKANQAFIEALGTSAVTHGAAGWQINQHVIRLEEEMGFRYASDVRGQSPFYPIMDGMTSSCLQLPTTLPTLDELIGTGGITEDNAHTRILEMSQAELPAGHVYTLHAELEGMNLLPVMEKLLKQWKVAAYEFHTLGQLYHSVNMTSIPHRPIIWGTVEGRSGVLAKECPDEC